MYTIYPIYTICTVCTICPICTIYTKYTIHTLPPIHTIHTLPTIHTIIEMEHQKAYDVIEVASADKSHIRKVGLVAVLSDDPALYSHFKAPGAFGGATGKAYVICIHI